MNSSQNISPIVNAQGQTPNWKQGNLWVGFGVVFLLAFTLHAFSVGNWGVGVSHDSIFYLSSAEHFLDGQGFSSIVDGGVVKPMIHFPPLYPVSLSLVGYFLKDFHLAANWIGTFFFAVNAVLVMALIRMGVKSLKIAFLGAVIAIISPIILGVHFEAMSEPIYLTFSFLSLGLLAQYQRDPKRKNFFGAALCSAAAYLARYVGITVVITGMVSILLFFPGFWKRKIQKSALFGMIGIIPTLGWYIRNYYLTGSFTNRVLAFHPITIEKIKEGLLTISGWILPETFPLAFRILIVFLFFLFILYGIFMRRRNSQESGNRIRAGGEDRLSSILLFYAGIYLLFLFLSLTFFDRSTRLYDRILIPFYTTLIILTFIGIYRFITFHTGKIRTIAIPIFSLLFILVTVFYINQSWDRIDTLRTEGIGFGSATWRQSEIVSRINRLGPEGIVYSNEAYALYYLTGFEVYSIPEKVDPVTAQVREDFQPSMEQMRERLALPGSALAVFHQGYLREEMPTLAEISKGLVIAHESRDGVIYIDPENLSYWEGR